MNKELIGVEVLKLEQRIKLNKRTVSWLSLAFMLCALVIVIPNIRANVLGIGGTIVSLILIASINTAIRLDKMMLFLYKSQGE